MEETAKVKDDNSFTALPAGDYDFVISKAEHKKAASTGRDMISIQAKVISGDYARRVVFNNFVLVYENPTSMKIFLSQMKVLGLDSAFFESDPSLDQVASALVGAVFRGKLSNEPGYNKVTKKNDDVENPQNNLKNFATPSAEARQAALSVPTANNPNPEASPSGFGGGNGETATPSTPVAPPTVPSNTPSAPPIPPPPPAPTF